MRARNWAGVTVAPPAERPGRKPTAVAPGRDLAEGRRQAAELRVALEISRAILGGLPDDAVLHLVARRARTLLEGDCALVRTLGAGGNVLVLQAAAWRRSKDAVRTRPIRELPRGTSIAGRVFDSGRSRLVADVGAAGLAASGSRELAWPDGGPALFVPLGSGERTLGTLTVQRWGSGRPFRTHDLALLRRLAGQAALALHHANVNRDRDRHAVAEERERLGRELHDGAIQSLYAVTLGLLEVASRTGDHRVQREVGRRRAR